MSEHDVAIGMVTNVMTDRVKRAIVAAYAKAKTMGHAYIGTEHLLCALMESNGVAANILKNLGIPGAAEVDAEARRLLGAPEDLLEAWRIKDMKAQRYYKVDGETGSITLGVQCWPPVSVVTMREPGQTYADTVAVALANIRAMGVNDPLTKG